MFNESIIEGYEASSVYLLVIEGGASKKNTGTNNPEAEG